MGLPPGYVAEDDRHTPSETSPAESDATEVHEFTIAGSERKDAPHPHAFLSSKISLYLHFSFPFRTLFEVQN